MTFPPTQLLENSAKELEFSNQPAKKSFSTVSATTGHSPDTIWALTHHQTLPCLESSDHQRVSLPHQIDRCAKCILLIFK
jgi:hypothetical protein